MQNLKYQKKRIGIAMAGRILMLFLLSSSVWAAGYHTITPVQLKKMLEHKDFFFLDVHIPEQKHIPGTDAFIDFRTIRKHADLLPHDKNTKIVVYCAGDVMSRKAAADLMDMGYTQVYDLLQGSWAFWQLPE